ncbi:4-hydroxy-3-methylbut-2-enyl diphosphate reductase [Planctomycetota bacterium]|nr:4-hydroxy-3-methylbut-2-enyl diphosphate reductase [Planctomycetota bacterium]
MGQDLPATGGEEVVLANPRGFCAGVDRAIQIVERALEVHGAPVFVLHEIVHNKHVLERLRSLGARFVASLEEVPEGSVTVFSAHGVSDAVVDAAAGRHLEVIDATCPLVTKVHRQAIRYEDQRREVILVGHPGHPEVEGTRGRIKGKVHVLSTPEEVAALEVDDADHLAYVTQTTLSVDDTRDVIDALLSRFPAIQGPALKDICYATQNRQTAVKDMIGEVDVLIVVGSENSSNSNRLRELGERGGLPAYLVDRPEQVQPEWVEGATTVGVTAGASAPEELVQLILDRLDELGVTRTRELDGEKETVVFQMPEGL